MEGETKAPPTCPGCGRVGDRISSIASHAAQKSDSEHPPESYSDAEDWVVEYMENHQTAEGSDGEDTPDTPGEGQSDGGSENPLWTAPEWDRDDGGPECPECGRSTELVGAGYRFTFDNGDGRMQGVTEETDRICWDCRIIESENGATYNNVN